MSEDRIGGLSLPEVREGLPDAVRGGNQGGGLFLAQKGHFNSA
jgi:hypothetical protein